MKTFLVSAAALVAFLYQPAAQAQAPIPVVRGAVKISKITPAIVKTPDIQFTGGTQKRSKPGEWLEVEVEFEVKIEEADELTFDYTIAFEKKLFTGTVTCVNIPKGRERYVVMYMAPRTLEKFTGGKTPTLANVDNVWIECKHQGAPIDEQAVKPGPIPPVARNSGIVLNKNETPFSPLFYDRYEAIKQTR